MPNVYFILPIFNAFQVAELDFDFPEIPEIKLPETLDIRTYVPKKNEHFRSMQSSSFVHSADINGVKSHQARADVYVNKEGNVDEDHIRLHGGDKPDANPKESIPKSKPKHHEPKFRSFEPLKFPEFEPIKFKPLEPIKFKPFEPIKFKPFEPIKFKPMEPITFKPIKPIKPIDKDVILNYVPKGNERFVAIQQNSHMETININGKETVVGSAETILNKDGHVERDVIQFHAGDKDKKQQEKLKKEKKHKKPQEKPIKKHNIDEEQSDGVVSDE